MVNKFFSLEQIIHFLKILSSLKLFFFQICKFFKRVTLALLVIHRNPYL